MTSASFDPSGKYLYVTASFGSNLVWVFARGDGGLLTVVTDPVEAGGRPTPSPQGSYSAPLAVSVLGLGDLLFIAVEKDNMVYIAHRNESSGRLSYFSTALGESATLSPPCPLPSSGSSPSAPPAAAPPTSAPVNSLPPSSPPSPPPPSSSLYASHLYSNTLRRRRRRKCSSSHCYPSCGSISHQASCGGSVQPYWQHPLCVRRCSERHFELQDWGLGEKEKWRTNWVNVSSNRWGEEKEAVVSSRVLLWSIFIIDAVTM